MFTRNSRMTFKIKLIIFCTTILVSNKLYSQVQAIDSSCEKWLFVASDSINSNQLHRKIMGRYMESGDSLQLIIIKDNSRAWLIHKSDSIFINIEVDSVSIRFKKYDTIDQMKISKLNREELILEDWRYRMDFKKIE